MPRAAVREITVAAPRGSVKVEQNTKLRILTAPVDGVVQQLAVHTIGGLVTPAQGLLVVEPPRAARNRGNGVEPRYLLQIPNLRPGHLESEIFGTGAPRLSTGMRDNRPACAMAMSGAGRTDRPHAGKFCRLASRRQTRIPKHSPTAAQLTSTTSSR